MNKRSLAKLIVLLLVVGFFGYVAINGLPVGVYEIQPLGQEIKRGLDLTGGVSVVYQAKDLSDPSLDENIAQAITIFQTRLTAEGFPEATVTNQGLGRVRIEIPINESSESQDPNEITEYLVKTAFVEFKDPNENVVFEGKDMVTVEPVLGEGQQYEVYFELNAEAAQRFAAATTEFLRQPIGIYLDGIQISAPTVESVISDGKGTITGGANGFTLEEASRLSQQIRSGVLPIEMEEMEVRSISATLGDQALEKGLFAGAVGVALVMLFMLILYRIPGLVADIALCIYMLIVFFALATIPGVQLTLPGIAGIILSIGMAVDANVVIFERFREELAAGRSLRSASNSGFARAFSAIIDSNITTVIAALVLLFFGTGPIKGFAITLLIGIITSFLSAVFISRGLLNLFIDLGIENIGWFARKTGGRKGGEPA